MKTLIVAVALVMTASQAMAQNRTDPQAAPFNVTMTVDASKVTGKLKPIWRFFGADEPNYALMKDGQKLMSHLGALRPGDVYFRAHNMLNTGDGTASFKWGSTNAYTEDAAGNPIYNWKISDEIIDSYRARGVHPYLEIGFMPEAMTSGPADVPYRHSWQPGVKGATISARWNTPPKDYAKWEELNYQWAKHNLERYGAAEVSKWYFEVWNEANLKDYWAGSEDDFVKLHDYAIAGIRRAIPNARVGGPDFAGGNWPWLDTFLTHVVSGHNDATGTTGTPVDFVSFHAKGQPTIVDGHVRMGLGLQLKTMDTGFSHIAAVPQLANIPVVIGESDPEGCAACPGPQNAYRNGTLYASYTAATLPRIMQIATARKINIDGALTWAFEFEGQAPFAGYRQLASSGIDLPVMNTFRLFAKLGSNELAATSSAQKTPDDIMANGVTGSPDVGIVATRTADGALAILIWHYHDDDVAGAPAAITLNLKGLGNLNGLRKSKALHVTQWRVDGDNGDAFSAWQEMGSPPSPDATQYQALEAASVMHPKAWADAVAVTKGNARLKVSVPRQGVTLLVLN